GPPRHPTTPAWGGRSPRPCPAGRPGPPSATPPPLPDTSRSGHPHPPEVRDERFAGDPLVRLPVPGGGLFDHLGRQVGRGRFVVPAGVVQPVADVLLVERRLPVPGFVP